MNTQFLKRLINGVSKFQDSIWSASIRSTGIYTRKNVSCTNQLVRRCSSYALVFVIALGSANLFAQDSSAPGASAKAPAQAQGIAPQLNLVDNVVFDNGGVPNDVSGNEMTYWLQTEDFVLGEDVLLSDVHFYLFAFQVDAWDGSLEYFIFADNGGEPGALITSGQAANMDAQDLGNGTYGPRFAVSFDLDNPVPLMGGETYWLGLHANGDYDTRDDVYWESGSEGFGSTGVESMGGTQDNWVNNGQHHWFLLTGGDALSKEIVGGNDLNDDGVPDLAVEVGILTPSTYDFKLTYYDVNGVDVLIEDAIPAEWDAVVAEAADGLIENGDFESSDFTGWSQFNSGSGGIIVDDGTYDPEGPGGPVAPFEGSYGSVTFQGGPGLHVLYQDVDVPEFGMPTLVWADNIENWAGDYSTPNQQWRVEVRDPSDDSVWAILRETLPGDPLQQAWTVYTADLGPWAGTNIRIAFVEQDDQSYFNARLDAVDIVNDPNMLNCVLASANQKDNGKSATLASCYPEGSGMSWFSTIARCHDNKKNKKCRPTSCGALYLNDGAEAFELDELGEPLVDEFGDRLPPILVSNKLCLVAVPDLNGGGIDYSGNGDEDGDTVPDYLEACDFGTDPCDSDSDNDGIDDGDDACPLQGDDGFGVDNVGCPIGQFPVRGTWGFSLDLGAEVSFGSSDIWFERVTSVESNFVPQNGATLAIFGSTQPTPADCAGAALSGAAVSFFTLGPAIPSDWLCAMTNQGNLSAFRIFSGDELPPVWNSQDIVIEYVTWP